LVAIPGEASGDAGVVAHALGRAGESLPAVRIVLKTSLRLDAALVHEAVLVDEARVESFTAVLGVQLVLGVDPRVALAERQVRQKRVREEEGREARSEAHSGADRSNSLLERGLLGWITEKPVWEDGIEDGRERVPFSPSTVVISLGGIEVAFSLGGRDEEWPPTDHRPPVG